MRWEPPDFAIETANGRTLEPKTYTVWQEGEDDGKRVFRARKGIDFEQARVLLLEWHAQRHLADMFNAYYEA